MTSASRKIPVSCFLITRNEEDVLDTALRSVVDLVDEIVVVDSGSSDRTVAIARCYGARVIERAWPGFGPQKRFAERACRNDWVLNLDADEALSPELAQEIRALLVARKQLQARLNDLELRLRGSLRRSGQCPEPCAASA